ncbi:rCG59351 [Rattus norvegicus]|uniref:RCG59351 n=1 Tax=Rattus norvegicus TaxID=10116 RepID=A6K7G9_RAT|nr:rCG59351 [Rattus norvegicus]
MRKRKCLLQTGLQGSQFRDCPASEKRHCIS